MNHEFRIITDLYKEKKTNPDEPPELILVKKGIKRRWLASLDDIRDIREVVNDNGKILKDRCELYSYPEETWITIDTNYEEMKKLLNKPHKVIKVKGFK